MRRPSRRTVAWGWLRGGLGWRRWSVDLIAELASAQRRQAPLTQQVVLVVNVNVYGGRQVEDLPLLAGPSARIRHRSWHRSCGLERARRFRSSSWTTTGRDRGPRDASQDHDRVSRSNNSRGDGETSHGSWGPPSSRCRAADS
eukprot:scaffold16578_cov70-Phaeocystis_antarctica.AAC.3